ncbi:MAG: signal peptidase I [Clostridia bacterium]|nr:signal peptidase I [Clostridia bacterium]
MKILKICGKVLSTVITVLLVLVIIFNVTNLVMRQTSNELQPRLFGFSSAIIISGSMEPTISVNDLVIYKEKDNYQVGDVVIFANFGGESLTTHRIVDIAEDGFITRGDANNTEDLYHVNPDAVYGAVWLVIPYVGVVSEIMMKPLGIMLVVLLGFVLVALPVLLGKKKEDEEEELDDVQAEIERLRELTEDKKD